MTNTKLFLLFGTSLSLIPNLTSAQCVATQDCATLGYTENSCSGGNGVKCPFGNKWACFKSESEVCQKYVFTLTCTETGQTGSGESCANLYKQCGCQDTYKYTCSGTGYAGGSGTACGGKYKECKCADGYTWDAANGECKSAHPVCEIGTLYYSDNTCSSNLDSSKTLLGVVIYSNGASGGGWIMTVKPIETAIYWSTEYKDIPGLTNYSSVPSDVQASCTNTDVITAYGNSSRYPAAWAAKNYKPTGTPSGKSWCLPSGGLLNNINNSVNFVKINAGITTAGGTILGKVYKSGSYYYERVWSSSEHSSDNAWHFHAHTSGSFNMGYATNKDSRNSYVSVRPVLAF